MSAPNASVKTMAPTDAEIARAGCILAVSLGVGAQGIEGERALRAYLAEPEEYDEENTMFTREQYERALAQARKELS